MAIIEFENVSFTYPAAEGETNPAAVDDVNFSIEEGDFIALVGRNGSGKSTLAKLMNGLFLPESGSVKVDGVDTADDKRIFEVRKTVGVVFQNPDNQMVATIIEDDIAFGPENLGLPPAEIRARVDDALASVGMSEYAESSPFRLSGGQKQRIAIAGVLALKPRVIVLDEATSMLDPDGRSEVLEVVKKLNGEGMTVVMITHFMEEAALCKKVVLLDKGKIRLSGGSEIFLQKEILADCGLELPVAQRIAEKLKAAGMDVGDTSELLTVDSLVEKLCR